MSKTEQQLRAALAEQGVAYLAEYLDGEKGRAARISREINIPPPVLTKYKKGEYPILVLHAIQMERVTEKDDVRLLATRLIPHHADELKAYKAR